MPRNQMSGAVAPYKQIPPAFVKKFGKQIPTKTKIEACNEKSREVEVQKFGEVLNFSKGWGNFVEENKLECGDFLVKLLGDSKFKITIYGKTCCVKPFSSEPLYGKVKEKEDHRKVEDQGKRKWVDEVDDDDYNKDEELKGSARRKNCEFEKDEACEEEDVIVIDSDSFDDKTGVLKQRKWKQRTKAADELIKFNSQYNFFQVNLTKSNINGGYLDIPKSFMKHMKMMKKEQKVKLKICKEFWSMGLQFIYKDRRRETMKEIRICHGWILFVKKNDLKMGDVCIFEMITSSDDDDNGDDVIFIVHVHRWDGGKSEFVEIF